MCFFMFSAIKAQHTGPVPLHPTPAEQLHYADTHCSLKSNTTTTVSASVSQSSPLTVTPLLPVIHNKRLCSWSVQWTCSWMHPLYCCLYNCEHDWWEITDRHPEGTTNHCSHTRRVDRRMYQMQRKPWRHWWWWWGGGAIFVSDSSRNHEIATAYTSQYEYEHSWEWC